MKTKNKSQLMKIHEVTVRTVEKEKLIEFLAVSLPENEKLAIDQFAVFEDKFAVDIDCCFWDIHPAHFNNKIQPVIAIDCRIKKYKGDGSYSLRMDKPDFVKTISLEDYLAISTEVKLVDFIRFDYNPRIHNNQELFMKFINAAKPATCNL